MRIPITICLFILMAGCQLPAINIPPNILVQNYDPQLKKTDGGWLYKGQPFNGYMVESGLDGRVLYKLPVIDGKEEGLAEGWFDTGEKLMVRHFAHGLQQGLFIQWWPNGNQRYVFNFAGGKMQGQQWVFYPNGHKRQESNFAAGQLDGLQRAWAPDGKLTANYAVKNNHLYGVVGSKSCLPVGH